MDIQQVRIEAKRYLIYKRSIATSEIHERELYDTGFGKLSAYVEANNIKVTGAGTVLYFKWNEPQGRAEVALAMPVSGVETVSNHELALFDAPASKALLAVHKGGYDTLEKTHTALMKHLSDHKLTYADLGIEEYVVSPMHDENRANWVTNVYYLYT